MGLGASASDTAFSAREASLDPRTWDQKLASPGWCSAWELEHETWWKPLEERRAPWRSWAATGQVDSLCQAMFWTQDEVHLAMWLGKSQPWSRWAEAWWAVRWRDQCMVADIRRLSDQTQAHLSSAQSWGDMRWMLPNGDLEPAWAGEGSWNVWLVTRDGSSAGDRELVLIRNWMANEAGPGVTWGVLSVDGDEQGLYATLKKRANVREQVRWACSRPCAAGKSWPGPFDAEPGQSNLSSTCWMLENVLSNVDFGKGGSNHVTSVMPSMAWGSPGVASPSWFMGYQKVVFRCTTPPAS